MPTPRSLQIRPDAPGVFHVISRVVRRCFLCGDGYEHRKSWIEDRLRELLGIFSAECLTYAVMSNHLHLVLRMDPTVPGTWSDVEVATRWLTLFPAEFAHDGTPLPPDAKNVAQITQNPKRLAALRERLGSLSWFMKCLKEPIAKRANAEDDCTGSFWEGRFKSVAILDQAALLACMTYVDLNPVRAKMAEKPEDSLHTGVKDRIDARQRFEKASRVKDESPDAETAQKTLIEQSLSQVEHNEDALWVAPIRSATMDRADRPLTPEEYIDLVDITGRMIKTGKRGAIPLHLAAILARLDLDVESWLASVQGMQCGFGVMLGRAASLVIEGTRRGLKKIRSACMVLGRVGPMKGEEELAF